MTLKIKFILLTLFIAIGVFVLGFIVIQKYHAHIPAINRMFPAQSDAASSDEFIDLYRGLKPEPNTPTGVYYTDRVLVLMYHDVSPEPEDSKSISVTNLEKQLELMKENNFHWISMAQYRDFILHAAPVPENAVLLTFDDGYESLYTYVYPLLKKYQAPASSFLIVDTISNSQQNFVQKLTWEQVETMHKDGIEFFSHTYNSHAYGQTYSFWKKKDVPVLTERLYLKEHQRKETKQEYEQRVTSDLKLANDILLQKLGSQNHVLAFPYGAFSKPLLRISDQLGIDITLTVKSGLNKPGQTNGFRLNAGGITNDPDLQLSLMKHALERLGSKQFQKPSYALYYMVSSFIILVIMSVLWLWMGWRLYTLRKSKI
jgi:biofilm PGA synthesis lipoprotein PgaB